MLSLSKIISDVDIQGQVVQVPGGADTLETIVMNVLLYVFGLIGIFAVVMIVIGGVKYTTSQGDPSRVKAAKDTILYAVIGLVVALAAFAIVNFILGSMKTTT